MASAAERAFDKLPHPPIFDPEFRRRFISDGVHAAVEYIARKHGLDEEEEMAVRAQHEGLSDQIRPKQISSTG